MSDVMPIICACDARHIAQFGAGHFLPLQRIGEGSGTLKQAHIGR
jgi:hypothetical protein